MQIVSTDAMPDLAEPGLRALPGARTGDCLALGRILVEHGRMGDRVGNPMLMDKFETLLGPDGPTRRRATYREGAGVIRAGLLPKRHGILVEGRTLLEIMAQGVLLRARGEAILFLPEAISAHARLAAETTARYLGACPLDLAA